LSGRCPETEKNGLQAVLAGRFLWLGGPICCQIILGAGNVIDALPFPVCDAGKCWGSTTSAASLSCKVE
jgi:hypothetical protein